MIKSSAPTRIDLAGGTLDIWPLNLFFGNTPTVNAAIDLYATVEITPRKDKRIILCSQDLELEDSFSSINALPEKHALELLTRTVKFYAPKSGLKISTNCKAPQGSGIGGSSALSVALHGALNKFTGKKYSKQEMIEIARNIETQIIGVPAGYQDYFPAMYGGFRSVKPGFIRVGTETLPVKAKELTRHFILCYTVKPTNSGINNWEVTKKTLDGHKKVIRNLKTISKCALEMHQLLKKGRITGIAPVFDREWKARKQLAPNISTPKMEKLIQSALKKGALAAKVCGAGGGGCVAFIVPPKKKQSIIDELNFHGGKVLPFQFVSRGHRNKFQ